MIKVENLVKSYNGKKVLDGISFHVRQGEMFALLGVNGAGKTTTLECLEGIRIPDSGAMSINGLDVLKEAKQIQQIFGVQLQSSSLPPNMQVRDCLKMFCAWKNIPPRFDLLEQFGLKSKFKQAYGSLSTGQKRRLHLAISLCHNPSVLILDEPTAGLDVEGRLALHTEIRRLKSNGITILLASHDMDEVQSLCDRIAFLKDGKLIKIGTPRELTQNAMSRIVALTENNSLRDYNKSGAAQLEDGYYSFVTLDAVSELTDIFSFVKANNDKIADLRIERDGLESLFINIAGGM